MNGYPLDGEKWLEPVIELFKEFMAEKTLKKHLKDEGFWVESRVQGDDQHLLVGERDGNGKKVHLIIGKAGEIRFDNKDMFPADLLSKVETILTTKQGKRIKSVREFSDLK